MKRNCMAFTMGLAVATLFLLIHEDWGPWTNTASSWVEFSTQQRQHANAVAAQNRQSNCSIPLGMIKVRVRAGFDMVVLASGDFVSDQLRSLGWWEDADLKAFFWPVATVPHSGTFLDVGGNLGYYSLMFAKAGYSVLTVEPMTRNRRAIEASLCLNPDFRVRLLPVALSTPTEVNMKCIVRSTSSLINKGNGWVSCGVNVEPCESRDENCENIAVGTLDSLLADVGPPAIDVVKMDVEDMECKILAGGGSLFSVYAPRLLKIETQYSGTACWRPMADKYGYNITTRGPDSWIAKS